MSEKQGRREQMDRFIERQVKSGVPADSAQKAARDAAIRSDLRESGDKNWRKPYGSND